MKEKILSSRFMRRISDLKICRYLSAHRVFGRFFTYETVSYIIAGLLTTAVNYTVYFLMPRFESRGLDIIVANVVSWTAAVVFAFFVNKIFVFDSPIWKAGQVTREFFSFIVWRLFSLGFDTLFMYLSVGLIRLNEPICKVLSNIFVLLINYFASKYLIFRKKDAGSDQTAGEEKNETIGKKKA